MISVPAAVDIVVSFIPRYGSLQCLIGLWQQCGLFFKKRFSKKMVFISVKQYIWGEGRIGDPPVSDSVF